VLRYDNLKSAVKKILRGHQREETARYIAFRPESDSQAVGQFGFVGRARLAALQDQTAPPTDSYGATAD